jgi:hypothetical protein
MHGTLNKLLPSQLNACSDSQQTNNPTKKMKDCFETFNAGPMPWRSKAERPCTRTFCSGHQNGRICCSAFTMPAQDRKEQPSSRIPLTRFSLLSSMVLPIQCHVRAHLRVWEPKTPPHAPCRISGIFVAKTVKALLLCGECKTGFDSKRKKVGNNGLE